VRRKRLKRNQSGDVLMPAVIQGLWIGPELSVMEQLSIKSFLYHGHPYHLYIYEDVRNIPAGTVMKDANTILPASMIFQYTREKSYAGFANFFRYKLLLDKGGWWADMDTVCLKPFDFEAAYVFSSEPLYVHGPDVLNSGIIKTPAGSAIMAYTWQVCQSKNPAELRWGETGPQLMQAAVQKFALESYIKPSTVFCPFNWIEWENVLKADMTWDFDPATHAVHLWNEMWRRAGRNKNQSYHPHCLYEELKSTFWQG
jgi:Glycosyltransferase sugar-binding region containing DXD motif